MVSCGRLSTLGKVVLRIKEVVVPCCDMVGGMR